MNRREFLRGAAGLVGGALSGPGLGCATRSAPATSDMNVLIFVCEDWHPRALGCYGNPLVRTPALDAFAATAVRFERAFCQSPLCNPSRASFLTGLRPDSTRVYGNRQPLDRRLPRGALTLPEAVDARGVYSASVGKLFHDDGAAASRLRAFDRLEFCRVPEGFAGVSSVPARAPAAAPGDRRRMGDSGVREEDEPDGRKARLAARMLEELAGLGAPFFLSVGFQRPHVPLLAPARYVELYDPEAIPLPPSPPGPDAGIPPIALRGRRNYEVFRSQPTPQQARTAIAAYYACVSFIDAQIGIVLEALERTGLAERTIVWFFADHGFHLGEHGLWSKLTLFDPATHVPLIVRVPGAPENGRACGEIVELVDLMPTLFDLWGLEPPGGFEGESLAPLLRERERPWKRAAFSVCLRNDAVGRSVRTRRHKYVEWVPADWGGAGPAPPGETRGFRYTELYDLEADPGERSNRVDDAAYAGARDELAALLVAGWTAARPPGP